MKKVIFLMLAMTMSLGLISCSSDDDGGGNQPQFNIAGTWKVTQVFVNGVEQNVNDFCVYRGTFQFINPGTFVENGYELVDDTDCTALETAAGTWVKNGNSYTLSNVTSTVLPTTFTPITNTENINKFELNLSGGIPARLVFTKL